MGKLAFVDSCILLDIFNDDPKWFDWSSDTVYRISKGYDLAINIIIFTEISLNFDSLGKLERTLSQPNIELLTIPAQVGFRAVRIFQCLLRLEGPVKNKAGDNHSFLA